MAGRFFFLQRRIGGRQLCLERRLKGRVDLGELIALSTSMRSTW